MTTTDSPAMKPLRVLEDSTAGYIKLPVSQLEDVRNLLESNQVRFWVDHHQTSFNGKPPVTTIYLRHGSDLQQVQTLLDTVA